MYTEANIMDKKEVFAEIKKESQEIECLIKVLKAYRIEEPDEIDIPTTMLQALDMIIDKIDILKKDFIKLKND